MADASCRRSNHQLSSRRRHQSNTRPDAGRRHRNTIRGEDQGVRSKRGRSQEAFADETDLHRTDIGAIERGGQNLSLADMERLAATLGVSLPELFAPFTDKAAPPT